MPELLITALLQIPTHQQLSCPPDECVQETLITLVTSFLPDLDVSSQKGWGNTLHLIVFDLMTNAPARQVLGRVLPGLSKSRDSARS